MEIVISKKPVIEIKFSLDDFYGSLNNGLVPSIIKSSKIVFNKTSLNQEEINDILVYKIDWANFMQLVEDPKEVVDIHIFETSVYGMKEYAPQYLTPVSAEGQDNWVFEFDEMCHKHVADFFVIHSLSNNINAHLNAFINTHSYDFTQKQWKYTSQVKQ